jgi:hypothetical protein
MINNLNEHSINRDLNGYHTHVNAIKYIDTLLVCDHI